MSRPTKIVVKTSDALRELNAELEAINVVREQVRCDLEDDARIEDLQERYREMVKKKYAFWMAKYFAAKQRAPFSVVMKTEEICQALDALYRLVK